MNDDLIFNTLGEIREFMRDTSVTEINVNDNGWVYVERRGIKKRVPGLVIDQATMIDGARRIATTGRPRGELNDRNPFVNTILSDGSRVAIGGNPISAGITMTIRKFRPVAYTLDELERFGMITREARDILEPPITNKNQPKNVLVSGGTGTGKTTFLNALLKLVVKDQPRIGLIEDIPEIKIDEFGNRFRFTANGKWDIRHCIREALRHTPQRLIIGEVRGAEAFDMIDALNTGHDGSFSTIHASRARGALVRLMVNASKAEVSTPQTLGSLKTQIAEAIHYIVQLRRLHEDDGEGLRVVTEIVKVNGYNSTLDQYDVATLYEYKY